jgi:hypothetical protein
MRWAGGFSDLVASRPLGAVVRFRVCALAFGASEAGRVLLSAPGFLKQNSEWLLSGPRAGGGQLFVGVCPPPNGVDMTCKIGGIY